MLEAAGYPDRKGALTAVSKKLNTPHNTLLQWYRKTTNPPPSELRQEKRFDLIEAIKAEVESAFGRLPDVRGEATYKEITTSIAIFIDKLQILEGKPTHILEIQAMIERGDVTMEELVNDLGPDLTKELVNELP